MTSVIFQRHAPLSGSRCIERVLWPFFLLMHVLVVSMYSRLPLSWETQLGAVCMPTASYDPRCLQRQFHDTPPSTDMLIPQCSWHLAGGEGTRTPLPYACTCSSFTQCRSWCSSHRWTHGVGCRQLCTADLVFRPETKSNTNSTACCQDKPLDNDV